MIKEVECKMSDIEYFDAIKTLEDIRSEYSNLINNGKTKTVEEEQKLFDRYNALSIGINQIKISLRERGYDNVR